MTDIHDDGLGDVTCREAFTVPVGLAVDLDAPEASSRRTPRSRRRHAIG
ncbi:MAG: hypothetical protein QOJ21_2766 [Solirubrobacteraceae bacterium]|jgi:hypothetical protein|nr:hypothetical protein [Solirubrobacteraceae bacterium]